jgi:dTDP-4-dehydrorhamnose reductase
MRILVTGVTGQVGSALCVELAAIGDVLPADRRQLDLSRPDEISDGLDKFRPELIVNPAAYTAVDRAEDESDLAYRVNAEAPGQIAIWAAAHAVPLIHFSTDYVFDGSGERPWREDDTTHPLSVYGASKLAGETAIRAARGPHLIIRTSWVYAASGTNFLRTIARLAREREELRIVNDQVGAPTSARLLAQTVAAIVEHCGAGVAERFAKADGTVNIAASGQATWFDFAVAIVDGLKARDVSLKVGKIAPVRTEDYPTRAKRPKNSRFELAQLAQQFAIVSPHWKEGLAIELDALAREMKVGQQP